MKRQLQCDIYFSLSKNRQREKKIHKTSRCNLCAEKFRPKSVHDRYCPTCKEEDQLLRFSEYFPELDASLVEKVSA